MFVKICGITSEDDALLATALDADALGFVFAPSKRQMHPEAVRDIVRRLPREIVTLGVFRDEHPERVVEIVTRTGLHGAQLHGRESPADVEYVKARVQVVIQAFAAGDAALAGAAESAADIILVDSPNPGSGKVFDWQLAEGAPSGIRMLLAGGLTPENVGDAIRRVRPWGVDVSTGVEESPGRKDSRKLREFVAAAREAGNEIADRSIDLTLADDIAGVTRPWDWQLDE
jgi:phosphoribosylanthranilate isomerase